MMPWSWIGKVSLQVPPVRDNVLKEPSSPLIWAMESLYEHVLGWLKQSAARIDSFVGSATDR